MVISDRRRPLWMAPLAFLSLLQINTAGWLDTSLHSIEWQQRHYSIIRSSNTCLLHCVRVPNYVGQERFRHIGRHGRKARTVNIVYKHISKTIRISITIFYLLKQEKNALNFCSNFACTVSAATVRIFPIASVAIWIQNIALINGEYYGYTVLFCYHVEHHAECLHSILEGRQMLLFFNFLVTRQTTLSSGPPLQSLFSWWVAYLPHVFDCFELQPPYWMGQRL